MCFKIFFQFILIKIYPVQIIFLVLFVLKRNNFIIRVSYNSFLPPQHGQNKRPQRRRTSPGAVNHLTPRCDWPAAEALISGARSWAQSECATQKRRCAPNSSSTLCPATTFKDYSVFPQSILGATFGPYTDHTERSVTWSRCLRSPPCLVWLISFGKISDTGNRSCTRRRLKCWALGPDTSCTRTICSRYRPLPSAP